MKSMYKILIAWALGMVFASAAMAQVAPSAHGGGDNYGIHLFGEISFGFPNFNSDYLKGATAGAYWQRSRWIGVEVRGQALQFGPSDLHQSSLLAGPRIQHRFHHFIPYAAAEGGVTHAVLPYTGYNGSALVGSYNGSWQAIGGVDYRLTPRIYIRAGEFTYGKVYVLDSGLNPKSFSAGVVYHLF